MFEYNENQFKEWKEKYGDTRVVEVVVDGKKAIMHKPSRTDLSYAIAGSSQGADTVKFVELLMRQCWIDGDREILEDDDYFLAAMPVVQRLAEVKEAEIKKL